jgi:predicted phage terminase large subunit-like protein
MQNNELQYFQKLYQVLHNKGLTSDQIVKALLLAKKDYKKINKEHFKEFLEIQTIIEPKWSYKDKFYQKLIYDFNFFVQPNQIDLDLIFVEAPPRTGKTELISVFGIPYILSCYANIRIIVVCGNQALKRKVKKGVVRVIKNNLYNKKYNINLVVNNANEILTNNNNLILFTTTLSETPTGEGFHFVFLVDPLTYSMVQSQAKTENAFEHIDGIMTRTQDDPKTKFIVDSQRLAINDFSNKLTTRYAEANQKFHKITMPYYFIQEMAIQDLEKNSYVFKENEYLLNRYNQKQKELIIAKVGFEQFETQYQQNPIATKDCILKPQDLESYYTGSPIEMVKTKFFDYVVMSLDTASTKNKNSDYTAITIAGLKNSDIYVLEVITVKEEFNEIRACVENLQDFWKPHYILIEDASTGTALISYFKNHYFTDRITGKKINITPLALKPYGKSKVDRLKSCLHFFHNKRIKIPEFASWLSEWKYELLHFPNVAHDDRVDSFSQLLNWKNNYEEMNLY